MEIMKTWIWCYKRHLTGACNPAAALALLHLQGRVMRQLDIVGWGVKLISSGGHISIMVAP